MANKITYRAEPDDDAQWVHLIAEARSSVVLSVRSALYAQAQEWSEILTPIETLQTLTGYMFASTGVASLQTSSGGAVRVVITETSWSALHQSGIVRAYLDDRKEPRPTQSAMHQDFVFIGRNPPTGSAVYQAPAPRGPVRSGLRDGWTAADAYRNSMEVIAEVEHFARDAWRRNDRPAAVKALSGAADFAQGEWYSHDDALEMRYILSEMLTNGRTPGAVAWVECGAECMVDAPSWVGSWDEFAHLALEHRHTDSEDINRSLRIYGAGGSWFIGRVPVSGYYDGDHWKWLYFEPRRCAPAPTPDVKPDLVT